MSDYSAIVNDLPTYYKGFARIENCEFNRFGQFSRDADDDSAYGILLSNLGIYNSSRPSYVRNNAFHHGLGVAVGIFSSNGFPIVNNVIHRTIDYGIRLEGADNIARGMLWFNKILRKNWLSNVYFATKQSITSLIFNLKWWLFGYKTLSKINIFALQNQYIRSLKSYILSIDTIKSLQHFFVRLIGWFENEISLFETLVLKYYMLSCIILCHFSLITWLLFLTWLYFLEFNWHSFFQA